ncbi:Six-hairpin glycosidase-like protein [Mrakia frigida]|uniref:Six-hairpin glycosidase-like protein n=1 Tax=Mrakia frigida TaxID=29902 RepID=UPI003FCC08C4
MAHLEHQNARFLEIASSLAPTLHSTPQPALGVVVPVPSSTAALGWTTHPGEGLEGGRTFTDGEEVVLDFGGHRVGHLTFRLVGVGIDGQMPDSPCRLRFTFGEVLNDVAEEFEPYTGVLSKAWLPEETITVDYLPQEVRVPRRWAFRYVKIHVVAVSVNFRVRFENILAHAVTSCPPNSNPPGLTFASPKWAHLEEKDKTMLQRIDEVSLATLRDCMQEVYEDGPRRDQRVWIGDLRLQALTSYSTFKDTQLAKRCLYLHAGVPFSDGRIAAGMFHLPYPYRSGNFIVDYSILYTCAVLEYVQASGDVEAGRDLYPTALKQFEFALTGLNEENVYVCQEAGGFESIDQERWHFVDWNDSLSRSSSIHSILILSLRALSTLETLLSLPPSSHVLPSSTHSPTSLVDLLVESSRKAFFRPEQGVFVSGDKDQISWASQAWAVLAGVTEGDEAKVALRKAYEEGGVEGVTPYLHHYLVEAFIKAGLDDLAAKHIISYWGSMVDAGAETFFETWVPSDPKLSPYKSFALQSFCHAWSATASLLVRRLGME